MNESNVMHGWVVLLGSLATIALILMSIGLMLGIVKPADGLKRIGSILGVAIVLTLIPAVLVCAWLGMTLWQRIALAAIGIGV